MGKQQIFLSTANNDSPIDSPNISAENHAPLRLLHCGTINREYITHFEKARLLKGLTIAEVCRETGLSYDNYIKYEKGKVKEQYMSLDTLSKLSAVLDFDFKTDYHKFKEHSAEHVCSFMSENQYSIRQLAKVLNVSATTIKHWRSGVCAPSYLIWERFFKQGK